MPNFNQIELKNKMCQTEQSFLTNSKQAFTQTIQPSTRNCMIQTDNVEAIQRQQNAPSLTFKAGNSNNLNYHSAKPMNNSNIKNSKPSNLNYKLNETFDEDQYDLDEYFNQENRPSTATTNKNNSLDRQMPGVDLSKRISEFKNKNLAYKSADKDLNEMFKNSIGSINRSKGK
jgi:hypothetical protein